MSAADRLASGYEPDFDIDSAVGHQGELFVARIQKGFADGSVQVKTDARALGTGNIYIEYECHSPKRGWHPSGVMTPTNRAEYWAHCVGAIMFVAPVELVQRICGWAQINKRTAECMRGSHPTRGALLTIPEFAVRLRKQQ